jgi:hypothetical protein
MLRRSKVVRELEEHIGAGLLLARRYLWKAGDFLLAGSVEVVESAKYES